MADEQLNNGQAIFDKEVIEAVKKNGPGNNLLNIEDTLTHPEGGDLRAETRLKTGTENIKPAISQHDILDGVSGFNKEVIESVKKGFER